MTSTIDPVADTATERFGSHIDFGAQAVKVGLFPIGSRQRMIGDLWLEWLTHVYACHKAAILVPGCPRRYTQSYALESAYPNWNCCDTHGALKREREQLTQKATQLPIHPAPHQSDQVLTKRWWFERGYHYLVGLPVFMPAGE